jgi:acetyl-CoA carboxylase biotin carboxylase subunit
MVMEGIKTNIPLQQSNMLDQMFQVGGFNIHYLERRLAEARQVVSNFVAAGCK